MEYKRRRKEIEAKKRGGGQKKKTKSETIGKAKARKSFEHLLLFCGIVKTSNKP